MASTRPQYFAALSISSLDSDGQRDDVSETASNITQTEMYQQLSYIEEVASNFFIRRPITLQKDHGVFSELEYGINQDFEMRVSELKSDTVVSITVECIPDCVTPEDAFTLERKKLKGIDFQPLEFRLIRKDEKSTPISCRPVLYNGEYCITLSAANGLTVGIYVMTVAVCDEDRHSPLMMSNRGTPKSQLSTGQTVRVSFSTMSTVRAIPIEVDKAVQGVVGAGELLHYRFVATDPNKVVGIQLRSITEDADQHSDPDLYVTNRHDGLVAASKDRFVWKSTNVGSDRIDIFPDDMHLATVDNDLSSYSGNSANRVYVISVHGYKDTNHFQLSVSLTPVVPIRSLALPTSVSLPVVAGGTPPRRDKSRAGVISGGEHSLRTIVKAGEYQFFSLRVDHTRRDMIAVCLSKAGATHSTPYKYSPDRTAPHTSSPDRSTAPVVPAFQQIIKSHNVSLDSGRAVYVSDDLTNFIAKTLPEYRGQVADTHPATVYISSSTKYPTADNCSWKTSAVLNETDGSASLAFVIDCEEWKYCADTCYFSITAAAVVSDAPAPADGQAYTLSVHQQLETDQLDGMGVLRLNMFQDIFSAIDGNILSHKDRSYNVNVAAQNTSLRAGSVFSDRSGVAVDDYSLTYQEVEYVPFLELLREAGAVDGQMFYDLGCGSGKAVMAAALSGIRFVKCVGIELLPTLAYCASEVINCVIQSTNSPTSPEKVGNSSFAYGSSPKLSRENLSRVPRHKNNRSMQSIQEQRNQESTFSFSVDMKQNLLNLKLSVPLLEIRHENVLDADWSDADFVFVSSLCFSDRLMQSILDQGAALRDGAVLLTLKLPERYDMFFDLTKTVNCKMSWGRAVVYVLVKRGDALLQ